MRASVRPPPLLSRGATPPSRISKDWRPSGFRQSAQPGGQADVRAGSPAVAPATWGVQSTRSAPQSALISPDDPPEVQEKLLKIEARLQQADWFLGQSKRRTD